MNRFWVVGVLILIFVVGLFVGCQKLPTLEDYYISEIFKPASEVDNTRPSVDIVSPKDYQIVDSVFALSMFVSDNKDLEEVVIQSSSGERRIKVSDVSKSPVGVVYSFVQTSFEYNSKGTNSVRVFARDKSGNYSLTNVMNFIVDLDPPSFYLPGVLGDEVTTGTNNFNLSVVGIDDIGVDSIFISVNGGDYRRISGNSLSTNLVFQNNSTNIVRVYVRDAVGKRSEYREVKVIVVSGGVPIVRITEPSEYVWFRTQNIVVKGEVSLPSGASLSKVLVSIGGATEEEISSPSTSWIFSRTVNVQGSNIVITARAVDNQNRVSAPHSISVGIDYTPPTVSISSPQNNATVSQDFTISGTANDNIGIRRILVSINNRPDEEISVSSSWSKGISINSLVEGNNTITVKVVDFAGNLSQSSITVIRPAGSGGGTQPPSPPPVSFPGDGEDPRDWTVYFVMTDRFVDGYSGNNNIYGDEYRAPNNNDEAALRYYNGGDFRGLINNLDYITNMGFNAIWITPVVKQPPGRYVNSLQNYDAAGYHGYWGYDFDEIDPHLESPGATFDDLIREAHNRGVKIILDIVPNHGHGGDAHPSVKWYNDRLKVKFDGRWWEYNPTTDPYRNNPNVSDIWDNNPGFFNYRSDYKLLDLLDFNECDPRTRQHIFNVYKRFIDRGVDGFRLDTVAYMRKQWWGLFADTMWEYAASKGKPWFWIVGEAWVATRQEALSYSTYSRHGVLSLLDLHGSCMDFPGQAKNVFAGGDGFERMASIMASDYSGGIDPTFLGTFVDNHDKPRFPSGSADNNSMVWMWRNALNWYYLARGIPIVYYGTEFEGTSDNINDYGAGEPWNRKFVGQDRINRLRNNPNNYPIYRHLRMLNNLRKAEIALRRGSQVNIHLQGNLAVFKREYVSSVAYVVINKGGSSANYNLQLANGQYTLVKPDYFSYTLTSNTVNVSSGSYNVSVDPGSFVVMVYKYPDPANSVTISGTYNATMTRVVGNLWRGTINVTSPGNVNVYINAVFGSTTKTYGDNDEVGTFLPVSGNAIQTTTDPITFNAPIAGHYQVEFNDATLSYSIKYVGSVPITTIICRSFVGGNNWVGVCGSYSPPTSSSDPNNKVPGMAWWGDEPATMMTFRGTDANNRNIYVWTSTNIPAGRKIEFKFRRNGVDWTPGANYSVVGGQSVDITYDWGLTANQGAPSLNDTTPPTVNITYPANGQVINNQTSIVIQGVASDNSSGVKEVWVSVNNDQFRLANGTTSWTFATNLPLNSSNTVRVFAIDVSNNYSVTNQISFIITNIPATTITIRYFNSSGWSSVNIHHNASGTWTAPPGEAMVNEGNGWWRKEITTTSDSYSFVFNNGSVWDNNNNRDYISRINYTTVYVSNRIVNIAPLNTSTTTPLTVTIRYYRPSWSTVKIHYNNGSGQWTTSPGVDMENEGGGWWKKDIQVVGNYYEFVFNNGSGTWDNNGNQNYKANIAFTNIIIRGEK